MNVTAKTVYTGSKFTLKATVTPELASATNDVDWSSSKEAVATVDNGVVTAKKAGSAVITAKVGAVTATCKVTVRQHVTSVKLNATRKVLYNGKATTLKATVYPSNASNKAVTWKTSNSKVATVNAKGVVRAKKPGYAYITVTTKDSKKTARCKVTVKAQKKSISLQKKGKSVNIKATVSPSNTYNKAITVSNSKKKVVKVSTSKIRSGKTVKVTALKKGSSKIKFTAADGSRKSTTVKVTVKK